MKRAFLKKYKIPFFILLLCMVSSIQTAFGQIDSTRVPIPQPIKQNAGFDVIVKMNGDLVYGLVKEVGPFFISYQRTDIPDGPVYTIPRSEVYVISYRNQVKDYINGREESDQTQNNLPQDDIYYDSIKNKTPNFFQNPSLHFGLGFLRSFSKVENVKNYSSSGSFPIVSLAYEISYQSNLQLGVMIGFGSHKFSSQQFSSYDSTNNNINLKENIFGLYVYGRYYFLSNTSPLQPFILAGPGIVSSNIHSDNKISFTNDNSQIILVQSGSRTTGLGIMARVGAQYFINRQFQVSLDAGVGLSVIKVGVSFNLE